MDVIINLTRSEANVLPPLSERKKCITKCIGDDVMIYMDVQVRCVTVIGKH